MKLITCSNSAPDMYSGPGTGEQLFSSPGGLVPMMTALFSETRGHWVFSAAGRPETRSARPAFPNAGVSLHPVWVAEEVLGLYRENYCVRTLLWLFHYLQEVWLSANPMPGSRLAWDAYQKVNQVFADELLTAHDNASDEVVLVNDLHLLLVPGLFAQKVPERASRLIYFHHVPWCEPEYFGIIPEVQRDAILKSLLHADIIGFHSRRWAQAFLACCERYIPRLHIDGASILHNGHMTRLAVSAGAVDQGILAQLCAEPETEAWRQRLARQAAGRHMVVRVDRMDLWKNHLRGFSAYERLLGRNPHLAADLWFCAVASPTRLQTERHLSYRARCEEIVDRINRRFGMGRETVSLLYPENSRDARHQATAALSLGSVTLVNPIWDGLNLVAKESVLLGDRSKVILSANAGVHDQLGPTSLSINPFDEEAAVGALAQAIETSDADAALQTERARELLANESASTWLDALLSPAKVL